MAAGATVGWPASSNIVDASDCWSGPADFNLMGLDLGDCGFASRPDGQHEWDSHAGVGEGSVAGREVYREASGQLVTALVMVCTCYTCA